MGTQSFYEILVEAYEAAERRGPLVFEGKSIFELLKEGEEYFRNNPL